MEKKYILLFVYFAFFIGLITYEVENPPFSRDAARVGNYEIHVSTTPSVPDVGKETKVHFVVSDHSGTQLDNVRMGVKVYYGDQIMKEFPPATHPGSWDADYVFHKPGNHVFEVDLFDPDTGNIDTYDFNITTLSLYDSIFLSLVIAGAGGAGGIVIVLFILSKRKKPNFRY
ncbi:MAG: hypothetical protein KGI33_01990 [Thaumarchaeota archaeon]|nr:hypothetical protein [Nitrososphaerota archaeon]